MKADTLVPVSAVARAAGCSEETIRRRIATGILAPDGWVQTTSGRQPVFRADRLDQLKVQAAPLMFRTRGGFMGEPIAAAPSA